MCADNYELIGKRGKREVTSESPGDSGWGEHLDLPSPLTTSTPGGGGKSSQGQLAPVSLPPLQPSPFKGHVNLLPW